MLRQTIIRSGLEGLYFTGAYRVLGGLLGGVGAILTLHHVRLAGTHAFQPNRLLEVTPAFLEDVVLQLRRSGVEIVTLDEMHRRLLERDFRRRFVCITFDDGYRDNREWAYPILKKHKVPFAIYVPTSFPDQLGELWWLVLERVIAENERIAAVMDREDRVFDCRTPEEKRATYEYIYWRLRSLDTEEELRAAINDLAARYSLDASRILPRPLHDLGRAARTCSRSSGDDRRAHRQPHHAAQGAGGRRPARDEDQRHRDRGRARPKAGALFLSGRRHDLGRPARVCDRQGARLQDGGDDAPRRAVPRAQPASDRAAADFT